MNSTIAKLADEFEKMEKTIASQKKMIETLMPTGYVDTDTVNFTLILCMVSCSAVAPP